MQFSFSVMPVILIQLPNRNYNVHLAYKTTNGSVKLLFVFAGNGITIITHKVLFYVSFFPSL